MAAAGTIESVVLNANPFNAAADADLTQNSPSEIEYIATSGPSMPKVTKRIASVEGVTLIVDGLGKKILDDLHDKTGKGEVFPMSYTEASGDVYRATGGINVGPKTTQENRVEITMMPINGGRFTVALAG